MYRSENPRSHSDHLRVLAYQQQHDGRLPGGSPEDMARQELEDCAVLEIVYENRFGLPPTEVLRDEEVSLTTAAGRAIVWQELANPNPPMLDLLLEGMYHRDVA